MHAAVMLDSQDPNLLEPTDPTPERTSWYARTRVCVCSGITAREIFHDFCSRRQSITQTSYVLLGNSMKNVQLPPLQGPGLYADLPSPAADSRHTRGHPEETISSLTAHQLCHILTSREPAMQVVVRGRLPVCR